MTISNYWLCEPARMKARQTDARNLISRLNLDALVEHASALRDGVPCSAKKHDCDLRNSRKIDGEFQLARRASIRWRRLLNGADLP